MSTFRITGTPVIIDESTQEGKDKANKLLSEADSRHAAKIINICELEDGETVTFAGVAEVPCEIDGKPSTYPAYVLKGSTSGKSFYASEKVFKSRSKVQPLAEGGLLSASGVVPTSTSPTQLHNALKAENWKCRIIVKKDYYASGVEMMSRFVGTEPLS